MDLSFLRSVHGNEFFYLTASRMVPYKKMPMIVQAFAAMPDKRLVVIGDGPEFDKCRAVAGPNVQLMGWQPFDVLKSHMQRARAFAAEEDFGITPLEAQACGTPVIAFGKGAVLETIQGLDHAAPTGLFFDHQTPDSVVAAVQRFEAEQHRITLQACRDNALRFAPSASEPSSLRLSSGIGRRFKTKFMEVNRWGQLRPQARISSSFHHATDVFKC